MNYKHLQLEERYFINKMYFEERLSINQISKMIKRSKSTISRELKRNLDNTGYYEPWHANFKYKNRQRNKYLFRLKMYEELSNTW
ncbi:helix-turn-helix domain-containing protein [Mycoplasma sp. E35C]|uniref:helix-turn-helix domain-containing protein n=1 Tax=Mycoplasma sp. E35C TaxID=2801918 RepID=UPI001CA43FE3|nr:helix-turn-helix domain-containing protein [Mycoplasma sp. E35C]